MLRVSESKSSAASGRGSGMPARETPSCGSGLIAGLAAFAAMAKRPSGMTSARRSAGAQRPASPSGSPRRPDPRSGRRRARLSLLLPVLALLCGALSLFAAAPAQAQPTVSISASPNPVPEGGTVLFTVSLSEALASDVRIPLTLTPGTTTLNEDHYGIGSVRIPAGDLTPIASPGVQTIDDTVVEGDETFTVALGTLPQEVTAGSSASVVVTIWDDDRPYVAPCNLRTDNIRAALNPTGLNVFSGDEVLTAAWVKPTTDKIVVDSFIRWKKDGTNHWSNAGGPRGNRVVDGKVPTYDITGLDNDAVYNVEVKTRAYDLSPHNDECIQSQWVGLNGTPRAPTSATPPTAVTVTATGPLREGGPPVNVYFTLDRPAPAGMRTTLGHDGHAWFKSRGPLFAAGARTAVMRISVPQDSVDNNCRTLDFRVWFSNGLSTAVSFSVVDDDGTADTCSGLLGSPDPTALTLPFGRLRLNRDWNSVTAWLLPTLDKPAVSATFVTVTHSVSAAADPTHFKVYDTRVLIRDGDTYPRYRNARGEWADFPVTVFVSGDADDSHTITLTARTDFGLTTRYALNVGDVRRLAGQLGDDPNARLQSLGLQQ